MRFLPLRRRPSRRRHVSRRDVEEHDPFVVNGILESVALLEFVIDELYEEEECLELFGKTQRSTPILGKNVSRSRRLGRPRGALRAGQRISQRTGSRRD